MAIILVASEICITLKLQLESLGHGLYGSVVRCELQSIQLRVFAILEEMLEKFNVPRTKIVPVS